MNKLSCLTKDREGIYDQSFSRSTRDLEVICGKRKDL